MLVALAQAHAQVHAAPMVQSVAPLSHLGDLAVVTFGERVRQLREERDLSLRELAKRTGMTNATISQIETGRRTNATLATVARFALAFGLTPAELLEGVEIEIED